MKMKLLIYVLSLAFIIILSEKAFAADFVHSDRTIRRHLAKKDTAKEEKDKKREKEKQKKSSNSEKGTYKQHRGVRDEPKLIR